MSLALVRFLFGRENGFLDRPPGPPGPNPAISGFLRIWLALGTLRLRREVTLIMSKLSGSIMGMGAWELIGSK